MTGRRVPKARDLRPLLRFRRPELNGTRRRLSRALTIEDLRAIAKRRTPRAAFDYTDGAAEGEVSLARARQAFRDVEFHPNVLRDVSTVDTGVDVLGGPSVLPFGIAPTGFTRMMHTDGERAGAAVAGRHGIPFALSTMGTTSIEDVAAANPDGRNWFQLYMWKDRERSMALVDRAAQAGFDTLLVTVDVPVAGARLRDVRNGMTIPPTITLRTVLDAAPRPRWWFDLLTTEPLAFASLDRWSGTVAELLETMFDPTVTFEDLAWIKSRWPGKLVVKGVQSVSDARRCADVGVDAITLSNHGGRQLDRAPIPFHLLPDVVREVGKDVEIHLDTGILNGADVVAAIALGARFTMVGRAYLYGLMAGGEAGAERAVEILADQVRRTMRLLGARTIAELGPQHVTQLERLAPRARALPEPPTTKPAARRAPAKPGPTAEAATPGPGESGTAVKPRVASAAKPAARRTPAPSGSAPSPESAVESESTVGSEARLGSGVGAGPAAKPAARRAPAPSGSAPSAGPAVESESAVGSEAPLGSPGPAAKPARRARTRRGAAGSAESAAQSGSTVDREPAATPEPTTKPGPTEKPPTTKPAARRTARRPAGPPSS